MSTCYFSQQLRYCSTLKYNARSHMIVLISHETNAWKAGICLDTLRLGYWLVVYHSCKRILQHCMWHDPTGVLGVHTSQLGWTLAQNCRISCICMSCDSSRVCRCWLDGKTDHLLWNAIPGGITFFLSRISLECSILKWSTSSFMFQVFRLFGYIHVCALL